MKISRIIICQFQQFDFIDIDLQYPIGHPKAGAPLDKVCFIGKNGTGKTTVLENIHFFLASYNHDFKTYKYAIKFRLGDDDYYLIQARNGSFASTPELYKSTIESEKDWIDRFKEERAPEDRNLGLRFAHHFATNKDEILHMISDKNDKLLIHSPSEVQNNQLMTEDIPQTNLNNALTYFSSFPYVHDISFQNTTGYWNSIIYQVKKRESDLLAFFNDKQNEQKTVGFLKNEFEKTYPIFLDELAILWDKVLGRVGLYFDSKLAKIPVQLFDNLLAYVKLKRDNSNIPFNRLSTGIRHYIFRLGYLSALYFNRKVNSAIALVDEPENSLFPDLLFDMIDQYTQITTNTQFFFATHSPIIASQFEPFERVILDFDENEKVICKKGVAAVGDEPNDVLVKDFGIESLLGREGKKMWERYVELKILIKQEPDQSKKESMTEEFLKIGRDYNF